MYIVLIGWLYCVLMLAVSAQTVIGGSLIALFLGILPTWGLLHLSTRRQKKRAETHPLTPAEQRRKAVRARLKRNEAP